MVSEQSQGKKWGSTLDIVNFIIALIALLVAARGCYQAERSLELAEQEFASQRLAVWQGSLSESGNDLIISAISDNSELQTAVVYFPPQIESFERIVGPPDFMFSLVNAKFQLSQIMDEKIPREPDKIILVPHGIVPIVLRSVYIAQGEVYEDAALYYLQFESIVVDNEFQSPTINIKGMLFGQRIDASNTDADIRSFLQTEWDRFLEELPIE